MHLSFDRIILPTTIAQVGPAVLRQFVKTKAPDLNPPDNGSGDDAAMMAAWFRGLPPEKCPALFEGLHTIGRVLGHEDAEEFLRGQQVPIAPTRSLGEILTELAISAPETLQTIEAHVSMTEAQSAKAFVSFRRARPANGVSPKDPRFPSFEKRCAGFFDGRGDGRYCSVTSFLDGARTVFVIGHATALRTQRVIGTGDTPEIRRFRDGRDAVVLVSSDGRRLEVSARYGAERGFFAQAIGSVFFDDANAFRPADRYDLEPICRPGFDAVVARVSDLDVAAVALRELVLVARDELSTRVVLKSRDVLATAQARAIDLDTLEPKRAIFAIVPRERRRRRAYQLTLEGNNTRRTNAPWSDEAVEGLLERLGLCRRDSP